MLASSSLARLVHRLKHVICFGGLSLTFRSVETVNLVLNHDVFLRCRQREIGGFLGRSLEDGQHLQWSDVMQ